jgi:hypothetical protein
MSVAPFSGKAGRTRPSSSSGGPYVVFPTLESRSWPRCGEPVSYDDAIAAIALGNGPILARFLRESYRLPDYNLITRKVADLLDPGSAIKSNDRSPASALANLRGVDLSIDWKLVFVRPGRGHKQKTQALDIHWIGFEILYALGDPPNVESAIARVTEQTGLSRATVCRAWRTFKSKIEVLADACKKQERVSVLNISPEEYQILDFGSFLTSYVSRKFHKRRVSAKKS